MRILILNTDYAAFLESHYSGNPGLAEASYGDQLRKRNETLFGVADFYSRNLRKLGHEAWELHANNEPMQRAWAREHGLDVGSTVSDAWKAHLSRARRLTSRGLIRRLKPMLRPLLGSFASRPGSWFHQILEAQIRHYQPDVVLNQAMEEIEPGFLSRAVRASTVLAGQIASPVPERDLSCYDVVVSSLPNLVDHFRRRGIPSELNRFAFEPAVLERLPDAARDIAVSFVGSLSPVHRGRVRLLEEVCSRTEVRICGSAGDWLPADSPIRGALHPPVWGIEMYRILRRSKIALNNHLDLAGPYANNMRLFEATGVGTLLVTDSKRNLSEMFDPGAEVVTYDTAEDAADKVDYYLRRDAERERIAGAGHRRTLKDHNYERRMSELVGILESIRPGRSRGA